MTELQQGIFMTKYDEALEYAGEIDAEEKNLMLSAVIVNLFLTCERIYSPSDIQARINNIIPLYRKTNIHRWVEDHPGKVNRLITTLCEVAEGRI